MQTIKTGVVVALLLAVCYGAFVALNAPDPELPPEIAAWVDQLDVQDDLDILDVGVDMASLEAAAPMAPADSMDALTEVKPSTIMDVAGGAAGDTRIGLSEFPPLRDAEMDPSLLARNAKPDPNPPVEVPQPSMNPDLDTFPPLASPPGSGVPAQTVSQSKLASPTDSLIPDDMNDLAVGFPEAGAPGAATAGVQPRAGSNSTQLEAAMESQTPPLKFSLARSQALEMAGQGQLKEALQLLSPYFNSPDLGSAESGDLVDILDALSREVIYSPRHLLEPAYIAKPTDTVASVAAQFQISPELLNAINGFGDSRALIPGASLKVIRGPFHAKVSLNRQELALFLDDMYAGRFPISLGQDPQPKPGQFEIVDRDRNRTYYGAGGVRIDGQEPTNPYGGFWLNLGDEQCIHGTPEMESSDLANAGCMSLAPLDARDVYNILVVGSQVVIAP